MNDKLTLAISIGIPCVMVLIFVMAILTKYLQKRNKNKTKNLYSEHGFELDKDTYITGPIEPGHIYKNTGWIGGRKFNVNN